MWWMVMLVGSGVAGVCMSKCVTAVPTGKQSFSWLLLYISTVFPSPGCLLLYVFAWGYTQPPYHGENVLIMYPYPYFINPKILTLYVDKWSDYTLPKNYSCSIVWGGSWLRTLTVWCCCWHTSPLMVYAATALNPRMSLFSTLFFWFFCAQIQSCV